MHLTLNNVPGVTDLDYEFFTEMLIFSLEKERMSYKLAVTAICEAVGLIFSDERTRQKFFEELKNGQDSRNKD